MKKEKWIKNDFNKGVHGNILEIRWPLLYSL